MTVTIKCSNRFEIIKKVGSYDHTTITYQTTTVVLSKHVKITEVILNTYKSLDSEGLTHQSSIEISTDRGSYAFEYPYELREIASSLFDELTEHLKPYIAKC